MNLIEWNQNDDQINSVLKHRQVKHFGYEFRYDTNNVDVDKPLVNEKMPEKCDFLWDRLRDKQINDVFNESPHQLTVNKYEPGQGTNSTNSLYIQISILFGKKTVNLEYSVIFRYSTARRYPQCICGSINFIIIG